MRILLVSNLYPPHYLGGYELICEQVNHAMRSRGHETFVLTSDHQVAGKATPPDEAGVERSLRIHGFFGHPWLGLWRLRELEFHNNRKLRERIAAFKPDVVHVFNLGGLSKSLIHTLSRLGVPTVYFVSDHWIARSLAADVWLGWWNRPNPGLAVSLARSALGLLGVRRAWDALAPTAPASSAKFPVIYFCSEFLRNISMAKGYDLAHAKVIHNAVDTVRFSGLAAPPDRPMRKLLCVGRLAEDKGVMTALKAMQLLRGRFPGELHIYGRGDADYTAKLENFVAKERLPVFFHSAGAAEMPAVYRSHDALLFTSEWEEPFALTPLEAMASGLPVVGTTTGGSKELFRHGENALTYTAGDAQELAGRVLELDANPEGRFRVAETGRVEVRAKYAEPIVMDQVERCLLEAVARRSAPSPVPV